MVYRKAVEFLALASTVIDGLPKGNASLSDQLRRSALSIPLNIAEGAGKMSVRDQQRYFSIARGSAFEAYTILDACQIMKLTDTSSLATGQTLLTNIVAMLTTLTGQSRAMSTFKSKQYGQGHAGAKV